MNGKLHLGEVKTDAGRRTVALPRFIIDELAAHVERYLTTGLVFAGPNGAPLSRTNFRYRVWLPALERAEIAAPRPRIHDLRHTAVALAIAAWGHPKVIQAGAGHSSIRVTMDTHGGLFDGQDDALAARLDEMARPDGGENVAKQPFNVVALEALTGGNTS